MKEGKSLKIIFVKFQSTNPNPMFNIKNLIKHI